MAKWPGTQHNQLIRNDFLLNGIRVRSPVVTGSTITIVSADMSKRLHLLLDQSTAVDIIQVDGKRRSSGTSPIKITIGDVTHDVVAHIVPEFAFNLLLGLDAMI